MLNDDCSESNTFEITAAAVATSVEDNNSLALPTLQHLISLSKVKNRMRVSEPGQQPTELDMYCEHDRPSSSLTVESWRGQSPLTFQGGRI